MPTFDDFVLDAKSRGKTREETLEGVKKYREQYGDFDVPGEVFRPDIILNESPTDNMAEPDKVEFQKVMTTGDESRFRARKYFEAKDGTSYQDENLLDQRSRKELGVEGDAVVDYDNVVSYLKNVTAPYASMKQQNASAGDIAKGSGASFLEASGAVAKAGGFFMEAFLSRNPLRKNPLRDPDKKFLSQRFTEGIVEKADAITPESWKVARGVMQVEAGRKLEGNLLQKTVQGAKQGFMLLADNAPNLVASRLNPTLGFSIMFSVEKESMYDSLIAAGADESIAENFSTIYASGSAPIEYAENAGRLAGAFGGKKVKRAVGKPVRRAAAEMLKNMGMNIGEEIGQDELFNVVYNSAVMANNNNYGTSIAQQTVTWEDRRKTAKASLQMSAVLDAFGIPIRVAQKRSNVKKTSAQLAETFGIAPTVAKKYAEDMSRADSQEELDLVHEELRGYVESKHERIATVTGADQIVLPDIPRTELINGGNGTPLSSADFDDIKNNNTTEEIAGMIEGDAGEVFARAVAGDAAAQSEYNRILMEEQTVETDTPEADGTATEQDAGAPEAGKSQSIFNAGKEVAKQEILPLVEDIERKHVEDRIDFIMDEMTVEDAKIELERMHQAYPELPKSIDKAIIDAIQVRVDDAIGVSEETTQAEEQIDEMDRQERADSVIPKNEQATDEQVKHSKEIHGEDTVRLTQEEGAVIRNNREFEELSPADKISWQTRLDNAKRLGLDVQAFRFSEGVLASPRVITPDEHAGMVLRVAQIENQIDSKLNEIQEDLIKGGSAAHLKAELDSLYSELDVITRAGDLSGTLAGQALNIRKMGIAKDSYKLSEVIRQATIAKGKALTPKESDALINLSKQIDEWQAIADKQESDLEAMNNKTAKELAEEVFVEEISALKGRRDLERIKGDIGEIKRQLSQLGFRMNDITGVTAEGSALIAKLAVNYIKSGAKTLDEVVKKVQEVMPDASAQNVYDALSGRHKQTKQRVRSEVAKRISELKTQAKLRGEIDDAMNGIYGRKSITRPSSAEVKRLRKQLRELQATAENTERSDEKLRKIMDQIAKVEQDLVRNNFPPKKQTVEEEVRLKEARHNLKELKRLLKTNEEIADLEERVKTGNFEGLFNPKTVRSVKSKELQDALVKVHQLKRDIRNKIHNMRKKSASDYFTETAGFMRAIKATADMSYMFRQGIIPSVGHPVIAGKAAWGAFKSFWSGNTADSIDLALRSDPMQLQRDKHGLYLSTLDESLTQREESFASSWADSVWMKKMGIGHLVQASERHMITGLNMLRAGLFDHFIKNNPDATDAAKTSYARYINIMTGRGDMKWLTTSTAFQAVMFSPKFTASRIQAIPTAATAAIKHPELRKEIGRQWGSFVTFGLGTLALAHLAGFKVGLDPDEPEFGKIVIDDRTRIDVWGGLQQPVRAFLRIAKAGYDRVAGNENKSNVYDISVDFFKYKASPIVTTGHNVIFGKDWVTNKDISLAESLSTVAVPLIFESAYEAYKLDLSAAEAAVAIGGEFVGMGVQTYEKPKKKKTKATW